MTESHALELGIGLGLVGWELGLVEFGLVGLGLGLVELGLVGLGLVELVG